MTINILIQMITVNLHYVRSMRAVPKWIQFVNNCLSFRCACLKRKARTETISRNSQTSDLQLDTLDSSVSKQADKSTVGIHADLLEEIRVWRKKFISDKVEAALSEEWRSIAHHLNRFFWFLCRATQKIIHNEESSVMKLIYSCSQ